MWRDEGSLEEDVYEHNPKRIGTAYN